MWFTRAFLAWIKTLPFILFLLEPPNAGPRLPTPSELFFLGGTLRKNVIQHIQPAQPPNLCCKHVPTDSLKELIAPNNLTIWLWRSIPTRLLALPRLGPIQTLAMLLWCREGEREREIDREREGGALPPLYCCFCFLSWCMCHIENRYIVNTRAGGPVSQQHLPCMLHVHREQWFGGMSKGNYTTARISKCHLEDIKCFFSQKGHKHQNDHGRLWRQRGTNIYMLVYNPNSKISHNQPTFIYSRLCNIENNILET